MSFTVKKYQSEDKSLWNSFVQTAKNATFLFDRDFMDYHSDRFEDFSLMVYKNNKLFALLPANKKGDTVYSHQGLTYGGFILQEQAKLLESFHAYKKLLEYLFLSKVKKLNIKNIPTFYNTLPADELEYFLFKSNAQLLKRDVLWVIDYRNILKLSKSRRQCVKRGEANGLSIKLENRFDAFWNDILIPNLSKKYNVAPVHTLSEINLLSQRFPDNIKQVNIYHNNKLVAGTTVFLTETTIHPQYISADENKNSLESLDFLYHYLINDFVRGKNYFDFNTSSENNGNLLNEGIIFWKESFGGRPFVSNNYLVDTSVYKSLKLELK